MTSLKRSESINKKRFVARNLSINFIENPRNEIVVLFAIPYVLRGGINNFTFNLIDSFKKEGISVIVVDSIDIRPNFLGLGDGRELFRSITKEVFHIYSALNSFEQKTGFLAHLIKTRKVTHMFIIGCEIAHHSLPEIKSIFPKIKVFDVQFNLIGHLHNNRRYSKFIDLTISDNSEVINHLILKYKEQDSKLKYIPTGINTRLFSPCDQNEKQSLKHEFDIHESKVVVTFLGRLSPEKKPDFFVEIAEKCLRKNHDIIFMLAGDGPMKDDVFNLIKQKKLANAIKLVGFYDSRKVLGVSDMLIIPSFIEGRPFAALEGLSMGVVVIATNVGDLPKLLGDGVGYVLEKNDINSFVETILELASNSKILSDAKKRSRDYAEKKLDSIDLFKEYISLLRN